MKCAGNIKRFLRETPAGIAKICKPAVKDRFHPEVETKLPPFRHVRQKMARFYNEAEAAVIAKESDRFAFRPASPTTAVSMVRPRCLSGSLLCTTAHPCSHVPECTGLRGTKNPQKTTVKKQLGTSDEISDYVWPSCMRGF